MYTSKEMEDINMKQVLKKIMAGSVLALVMIVGVQAQTQAGTSKIKVNDFYADYNKKLTGQVKIKNYRLVVKEDGRVIYNRKKHKKKFSVNVGKKAKNTKFKVMVKKLNGRNYSTKTIKVKAKWWATSKYSREKGAVKTYKKNDSKLYVFCKSGYYMNVSIYGNNGKSQKARKLKNANIINIKSKIDSIEQVNIAVYKKSTGSQVYTSTTIPKSDSRNDDNWDDVITIDDDINWRTGTIDEVIAQTSKSDIWNGKIYKKNAYTVVEDFGDGDANYGIIINPYYSEIQWYEKSEYDKIMNEIKRIVQVSHVTDDMSDQEKAYRLARYIINHIDYDVNVDGQKIEQALFEHKTVCAGFSKTYALICRYVGIDCDCVYSPNKHGWNYVKMGKYYYVTDLTRGYFGRKANTGVDDMLQSYSYLSKNSQNNMDDLFKTSEYTKSHPVDTMNYLERCEKDGISHLTRYELCHLPE